MADRLTEAFNALRAGGAVFAGRVRLTNWSDNARGMNASFRLDASADPLDNPAAHPFKGAHCSPKDGHEFLLLCIPVASEEAKSEPAPAPETPPAPAVEPERPKRDVTMAQRAALFCQEKDARGQNLAAAFFPERYPHEWQAVALSIPQADHERADACLKYLLGIKSKRELDTDTDAATAFQRISRELFLWRNEEAA